MFYFNENSTNQASKIELWPRTKRKALLLVKYCLLWGCLLVGCSNDQKVEDVSTPVLRNLPAKALEYVKTEATSSYGMAESYIINDQILSEKALQLSNAILRKIDIDENHNSDAHQAYTVISGGNDPIILSPKVFIRNTAMGGGIQFTEDNSGDVHLYLSIALVNGLESKITTSAGDKKIPENLQIQYRSEYIRKLEDKIQRKAEFVNQIQCPTEMTISIDGKNRIPVQVKTPLKACPVNSFFPVEAIINKNKWNQATDGLLNGEELQLDFDLDLRVPLLTKFYKFKLSKDSIYKWLVQRISKIKNGGDNPIGLKEFEHVENELINTIQETLNTKLEIDQFEELKTKITQEWFFERADTDCFSGEPRCYLWKRYESATGEFSILISFFEYFGKPLKIHSTSTVSNLLSDPVPFLLKSAVDSPLVAPNVGELNNLFQTVYEGEVLEFHFQNLRINKIEWAEPKIQFIENWTCTSFGPIPTREEDDPNSCLEWVQDCNLWNNCNAWADQCVEWEARCWVSGLHGSDRPINIRSNNPNDWHGYKSCGNIHCINSRRYCSQPVHECVPGHWYNTNICKRRAKRQVPIGAAPCLNRENQWQRVTTFSTPSVSSNWRDDSISDEILNEMVDGLTVHFELPGPEKTNILDCKMSDLEHRILADQRILITFKNTEKCKPFDEYTRLPGHGPGISLINQFSLTSEYQCGEMNEHWQGARTWTCRLPDGSERKTSSSVDEDKAASMRGERIGIYERYYPRTEISGESRIIGSYLVNWRE